MPYADPAVRKRYHQEYIKKNGHKYKRKAKDTRLKRKYGISLEQRDHLFIAQGSRCAICGTTEQTDKNWHTDHCHKTGAVRGILCHNCNRMIGYAKDNISTLASAIAYLKAHSDGAS